MNSSTITRVLLGICVALVLSLVAFSVTVYDSLPDRIPTHFNGAGEADAYGSRSSWWMLTAMGAGTAALAIGIAMMLPRKPALLNVPNKAELLNLPLDAQRAVVQQAQPGMLLIALWLTFVFAVLQYSVWAVSHGRKSPLLGSLVFILPLVVLVALPAILIPVSRELARQQRALKAR
jgi:uncharacterized membrane protein